MHNWIKENQKKVMAVLGAMLMVTFLINVPASSLSGRSRSHGAPVGTIGKDVLYTEDLRQAELEWQILSRSYARIGRQIGSPLQNLGETIVKQVQDNPVVYLLLIKEAEQKGIDIPKDVVGSVAKNDVFNAGQANEETFLTAVRHYLMVKALRDQLLGTMKLSDPMWKHELAAEANQVSLNLVEFAADQNKLFAPVPTPQQVTDQYNTYKNTIPETSRSADNPLGFGYEVPNRVKLQYLAVSRIGAINAVRASKDAYDLDVQARVYYLNNQSKFTQAAPATQPIAATAPSTTQPATQPLAKAGPTTRPYNDVKEEILQTLLKPEGEAYQKKVVDALHDRLVNDYIFYRAVHPITTQPTTLPAAVADQLAKPQATGYDSYAYLEGVALEFQKQYNLLPEVHQLGEWEDAAQLAKEPGIGSSQAAGSSFAEYATERPAPFVTDPAAKAAALQVLQPSELFANPDQTNFIIRITDASPAHAPTLAEVLPRVTADAQLKLGWEAAKVAAQKLLDAAKKSNLVRAALDDGRQSFPTGSFEPYRVKFGQGTIPNFIASPESVTALATKAVDLLSDATPTDPHPLAVIPFPAEKKVDVAQLAEVTLSQDETKFYMRKLQTSQDIESAEGEMLSASYFTYDAIAARMGYKPEPKKSDDQG